MKREISFCKAHSNEAMKYKFMCLISKYLFKRSSNKIKRLCLFLLPKRGSCGFIIVFKKSGFVTLIFNPEFYILLKTGTIDKKFN